MDDSQASTDLDAEFRRILRVIKPYIPCIMNNDYLTSYRLWLEKLSVVDPSEKEERNKYVIELCYQIQDGILEYPFTELPNDGPLLPFRMESCSAQQKKTSNKAINQSRVNARKPEPKHYQPNDYFKEMLNREHPVAHELQINETNFPQLCKKRTPHTISKNCTNLPQDFDNLIKCYLSYTQKSSTSPCNSTRPTSEFQTNTQENNYFINKNNDDDSWCDMSEGTTTTIEQDDLHIPHSNVVTPNNTNELYEKKIAELMNIINDLQKQNLQLNEDLIGYKRDISISKTTAERSIQNLVEEINSLRSRLQELNDVKAALKNSQAAAAGQWKEIVDTLTCEMQNAQRQNEALQEEVNILEQRLEEATSRRQQENKAYQQKLSALHEIEIKNLKEAHVQEKANIQSAVNEKMIKQKVEYESKIENLKQNYEKVVQSKDNEIQRLENLIEVQCKRMHEEVSKIRTQIEETPMESADENLEKIAVLQKCISKMDKLFKRTEKSFNRQVAKLKTEIEMRDKIIHIQLSTKRAEIIANMNMERQVEIDATIGQLEERYKNLLESQKAHFVSEKRQDDELISELRAIIAQHNLDRDI